MSAAESPVESIYFSALAKESSQERIAYLDEACGGDADLRRRVERLLEAQPKVGSFLQGVAAGLNATAAQSESVEMPGTIIGPYKLLQQIGEGGMGVVFMAEQSHPIQRKVALKVIKAGMDRRQVIARFEAERQALAMMDHANIARVLDAGTTDAGRPYFVMDLVKGVPITKYCDEHHVTPRQRLELFVPVCQAIQHAHQKGIIHRDLKPSNVLVALYDGKPVPKVIDFGVAKAAGQPLTDKTLVTGFGNIVGTLEYMSPEQAEVNQLDIDTRSDIYSLGVLLYELLTGTTPFTKKELEKVGMLEMLRVIREQEPTKPSTKLSTAEGLPTLAANRGTEPAKLTKLVRGELDWIVMKALEKDRNRRYETANGFAMDVQRYLADEPVLACPPSAGYRLRKFARRNKTALAVAGLILLFIAVVGGGVGWVARDRAARDAALDDEVQRNLDQAAALVEDGKCPRALEAVDRAEKLLLAAGRRELTQRLLELKEDLALAQRLSDIYSNPRTEDFVWGREPDAAFVAAFADQGIDVAALSVAEAAERIHARGIRRELTRALDFWATMRQRAGIRGPPDWTQLLKIAELADPDPWRNPLRQARRRGDRKALEALATSADIDRQPPANLVLLGGALYDSGAQEQALELLGKAHLCYPDDWWVNNFLGWYCFSSRPPQYDEAIRYYTAAQAIRPRNPYTLHAIGRALAGKHADVQAIAAYRKAIELKPDFPEAYASLVHLLDQAGRGDEVAEVLREAAQVKPDPARTLSRVGLALDYRGLADWAITACREATHLRPDSAEAHYHLGELSMRQNLWNEAIAEFLLSVQLSPQEARYHHYLGYSLFRRSAAGDPDKAVVAFKEAIRLQPNPASAIHSHYHLGELYERQKLWEKAIDQFRTCNQVDPQDRATQYRALYPFRLAIVLRKKGLLDEAIAAHRDAVKLQPDWPEAHFQLAFSLTRKGLFDEAVAVYRETIELKREHALAHNNLAWLLATCPDDKLRDPAEAVRLAKRAVELAPKAGTFYNTLGAAHYRAGDWKAAIEALNKSMELRNGGDSFDWFFLAMANWQWGAKDAAREWYDQAVAWMEKNNADDEELRRFRFEVEELLGVQKK